MIIVVILSILLVASLVGNALVTLRALKISNTMYVGGLAVEEALDSINRSYEIIGKILELPLATNDPKVIQIHKEFKRVHNHLLIVASRLEKSWNNEYEEKVPANDHDQK